MTRRKPAANKLKVLFAGVDGTGKTACVDTLIARLQLRYRVLFVRKSTIFLCADGRSEPLVGLKWDQRIKRFGESTRRFHLYGVFLVLNFIYKYFQLKFFEIFQEADVVVFETDTLLHPSVYIEYHFPRIASLLSAGSRFRLLSFVFGSVRSTLIIYLETDPAVSMERIERREREEGIPIEPHENQSDLARLKAEFERVLQVAHARGYAIVRIDTTACSLDEVATRAEAAVQDHLPTIQPEPGPGSSPQSRALEPRPGNRG